eukprot:364724-Chlamydomonas_euryale.AAC.3
MGKALCRVEVSGERPDLPHVHHTSVMLFATIGGEAVLSIGSLTHEGFSFASAGLSTPRRAADLHVDVLLLYTSMLPKKGPVPPPPPKQRMYKYGAQAGTGPPPSKNQHMYTWQLSMWGLL